MRLARFDLSTPDARQARDLDVPARVRAPLELVEWPPESGRLALLDPSLPAVLALDPRDPEAGWTELTGSADAALLRETRHLVRLGGDRLLASTVDDRALDVPLLTHPRWVVVDDLGGDASSDRVP